MFGKIFKRESKEFKEFKKIIIVYNNLVKHAQSLITSNGSRTVLAMTELDLRSTSQILGIKLREWKTVEGFSESLTTYITESIDKGQSSGLPSSSEFVDQNHEYLRSILNKIDFELHEPEIVSDINVSDNIIKEIKKLKQLINDFQKLFNIKRKMHMDPQWTQHISFDKEDYSKAMKYFSQKEISKFIEKLSHRKSRIFALIEEEGSTIEFYKDKIEELFNQSFIGHEGDMSNIEKMKGFIGGSSYYISLSSENNYYCHLDNFVESDVE